MPKKTKNIESLTPSVMWMGCGYRAHLMGEDCDSSLVIICPDGQEAIIIPRATDEQWMADVKSPRKKTKK